MAWPSRLPGDGPFATTGRCTPAPEDPPESAHAPDRNWRTAAGPHAVSDRRTAVPLAASARVQRLALIRAHPRPQVVVPVLVLAPLDEAAARGSGCTGWP